MSRILDNLELVKNQIHLADNKKFHYVKETAVWNWDVLLGLILVVIMFPFWIRDVTYKKVKNNKYKKEDN